MHPRTSAYNWGSLQPLQDRAGPLVALSHMDACGWNAAALMFQLQIILYILNVFDLLLKHVSVQSQIE